MFTRSFEIRSEFIRYSFLSRSFPTLSAFFSRFFLLRRRRSLFIPRNALSEIEKSMERIIKTAQIINKYEGTSSIYYCSTVFTVFWKYSIPFSRNSFKSSSGFKERALFRYSKRRGSSMETKRSRI